MTEPSSIYNKYFKDPKREPGCRLIGSNVHQLEESGKEYAISTMCVGLGMGLVTIVKNENSK
ncbi:MAG: hypothetical protein ACW972_09640 [Promethearchaeota archaeon]|jgi:hypothetical protein